MPRNLDRYREKRDPARTNEPFGAEPVRSTTTRAGRFVVHLHDATREHYDLRLEVGGVLQSFAVPKGPSLRPLDKHLAIHTEAHPIDYLDFEAVIPEGNYGAGPMIVWDRGAVHFLEDAAEDGLEKGKLDFVLQGFKLRGRFALVKIGKQRKKTDAGREWLLFKKQDAYAKDVDVCETEPQSVLSGLRVGELARAREIAAEIEAAARDLGAKPGNVSARDLIPMRCGESNTKLDDARALYELKLDGVRIVAERNADVATLRYRTLRNATQSYPEVTRALRALAPERVVLDGEVVTFDERGKPSFALLGQRIHAHGAADVRAAMRRQPVVFLAFDVLALGELDLRPLPLRARKLILARLLTGKGVIRALDHVEGHGEALMEFCNAQGLEGVIGKRAESPYVVGPDRSTHWWKVKRVRTDDFVIVGYTRGDGSRKSLGALELASFVGDQLVTRGRVGSGLDAAGIDALLAQTHGTEREASAASGELQPAPNGVVFVAPKLVASVEHSGFTPEGRLRHPVFRGLRDDVGVESCTAAPQEERESAQLERVEREDRRGAGALQHTSVPLTNVDKVFWPDEGITKGQLCEYYASIADTLLPYLRDRPVLMVRYPDGIRGKNFFQWNAPAGLPDFVHTRTLHSEDHSREITFLRIDDVDALVYVANLGCIPLHILAGRFSDLSRCDFVTIDFDLGGSPLSQAITLARTLHELLDAIDLKGFAKTSGQTGLHVLVPVGGIPFPAAKALVALLGRIVHERHPELSTLERSRKQRRPNTVYIDTGQTGESRAIVAPYSVRAYPGARVSTPITWDEVGQNLLPARFDIFTVPDRVSQHGDPMHAMLSAKPDIAAAIAALEKQVRLRGRGA